MTARSSPPLRLRFRIPLLLLLFLGLIASRRWAQFVAPQVWDEEGAIVGGFIAHGWREFLLPLNGYLVLVPKLIVRLSLAVSFYHYPWISTSLAWLFTAGIGAAIALAPTYLRGRLACAVAVFAIPANPETFGLALYTLWWASLPLFLVVLWDESRPALGWRLAFVAIGGLSSPLLIALLPALYFRAIRFWRLRAERYIALAATAIALLQAALIGTHPGTAHSPPAILLRDILRKFFGWFLLGNVAPRPACLIAAAVVLLGAILAWALRARHGAATGLLLFLLAASIACSAARVDPSYLLPSLAGPRYFFFPFSLLGWILIQGVCARSTPLLRAMAAGLLGAATLNALPVWSRSHADLHWAEHVRSARLFPEYDVPIQWDGRPSPYWTLSESGTTWESLLHRGWWVSFRQIKSLPTFPFRVLDGNIAPARQRPISPRLTGQPRHEFTLDLHRGDRLRFRSGPASGEPVLQVLGEEGRFLSEVPVAAEWVWLDFTNAQLPATFSVKVCDTGRGLGEWSAIGTPN